jgi:signal transduction histidine kinase
MNQAAHEMFGSENGFWESEFAAFIDFLDAGRPLAAQLKSPARRQGNLNQRTLEAQAAVVHGEDGEELGIVLSFRDVTHTARALELKDNFIAKQAQQMRIPLLKMKLAGERLHQLAPTHPIVKAVRENTRLMRAITGQALDVAEMIEGNFAIRQDPVTLEPLLSEVLRTHTPSFQDAGIELRTMMLDRHLDVSGDVRRLRMALDHLLDNARAYTPAGGTVTVSMSAMIMGYAAIDLTDTGIGIPSEDIPDIFEPYQRGSNLGALNGHRSALDGLGLGLFIVQHIAQAHGGKLTVSSTPNEGSTFSLVLPLSPH